MKPVLVLSMLGSLVGCAGLRPYAGDPAVVRTVIDDDGARIEELRVRGQAQRMVVQPKAEGAKEYEIVPASVGFDPSQQRDASGQRVWKVLSF
jgi:hypothetical protein